MRPYAHGVAIPKPGLNTNTRRPRNRVLAPAGNASIRSPRPRITTGPSCKKSAQSEPSPAAIVASSAAPSAKPDRAFSARNAATASLLPPPSPAPIGTRFMSEKSTPRPFPGQPVAAAKARAAFTTKFVSSVGTVASSQCNLHSPPPSPRSLTSARNVSPKSSVTAAETKS